MSFDYRFNHEQSRALNGIGSSSSRGTKRTSLHDIYDEPNTAWKQEPTTIQTASTRRPKNVPNPFSARLGTSERSVGRNPIAARTAISQTYSRSGKRARTSGEGFGSLPLAFPGKYSRNDDVPPRIQRAIPSTIRAGPTSSHNATTSKYYRERENGTSSSANVISVGSEPEDSGTVMLQPHSRSVTQIREEIDLIDEPSSIASGDRASLPRSLEGTDAAELILREHEREEKPSLRPDAARNSNRKPLDLWSRSTNRHPAEDGPSTKRLNDKLMPHEASVGELDDRTPINNPSQASTSGQRIRGPRLRSPPAEKVKAVPRNSDEIEEFPEPSSSKFTATESSRRPVGSQPPGPSSIHGDRVRRLVSGYEANSRPPYYSDLREVGRNQSRINRMKGKDNKGTARVERPSGSAATRDKLATASTSYTKHLAFPLELLIWGNQKTELDKSDTQPRYWLYWNETMQELQIHKHPPDPKTLSRKKPEYSVSFSILTGGKVQISEVSDFHLLRFELPSGRHQDLPDHVRREGLTFKFMSNHSNMTDWGTFASRLRALLDAKSSKAEILKGSNASRCLESALRSVAIAEVSRGSKRQESAELEDDPIVDADSKENKVEIVPAQKKRQPRPRPVTAGRNQNIAEMFQPRRRSSRLSEATKPDTQKEGEQHGEPPGNADEIILVYPRSGQGAVNITNGDLRRLDPYEFLNDTLIEFGLKLWLSDLREAHPDVADSIHVFSSFFFKKLVSKSNKTPEAGHKSVRKWTAKVDLFKKKFIIVPINENIHWYLAIIYQPEHILEPAPPKPPPRSSKRVSNATAGNRQTRSRNADEIEVANSSSSRNEGDVSVSTPATVTESISQAEAEVEGLIDGVQSVPKEETCVDVFPIDAQLNPDGHISSNIEEFEKGTTEGFPTSGLADTNIDVDFQTSLYPSKAGVAAGEVPVVDDSCSEGSDEEQVDQLADDDDDNEPIEWSKVGSPIRIQSYASAPPRTPGLNSDRDYSREPDVRSESLQYPDDELSGDLVRHQSQEAPDGDMDIDGAEVKEDEEHRAGSTVSAASFYGKSGRNTRTYAERRRLLSETDRAEHNGENEVDELDLLANREQDQEEQNDKSDDIEVTNYPRTIIFCMDSLNGNHPRALSRLNEYLQEEAKDKKGIAIPSPAKTRKATMPIQPNHCDCGLYLLHFAQSFVADPEKYIAAIFSSKRSSDENRKVLWNIDQVTNMRERLKDRILVESALWKKQKAEKEQKVLESRETTGTDSANQPPAEPSDDEIEVSEVRLVGSSPRRPARTQAAARLR